jgi:GNAT superfamily N-acetyltransferase
MKGEFIEELSLNNWPALSTMFYDGWALRFADGYTKRANSISPIFGSTLDVQDKIQECERIYSFNRQDTIFKITPFIQPNNLDEVLEEKGYKLVDLTSVQTMRLDSVRAPDWQGARLEEKPSSQWLATFCRLNHVSERYIGTMERMLSGIRTKSGFLSLYHKEEVIACGFGVIERGYIGLYDVVTDERYRNRGFGEQLLLHLLQWGKANGAYSSYLAVVLRNEPAVRLYEKLGYAEIYKYWYRTNG